MPTPVTCLVDGRYALAECPTWDERTQTLFWADIRGCAVHAMDWATRELRSWTFENQVGSFGLTGDGRLVVAVWDRILLFDPQSGDRRFLAEVEADLAQTRLNDGKVGPDGAFWVGTMDTSRIRQPIGALYRVSGDGAVRKITGGLHVSNGLAWAPDGRTLYHADSTPGWIDAWDFDPRTGAVGGRRRVAEMTGDLGRPDGATVDVDGNYWSAGVSAGVLNVLSPVGAILRRIALPVPRPTMPCFCGPDLDDLVVTSLRPDDEAALAAAPHSGSLFHLRPDVRGLPGYRFHAGG
ncbi:SMP-30/gluconolactonase/LRE family protein [Polymorphum gilvum]|uniref:SMP-30/Gluconolaconase/LRE-like region superfamily n=1 Tax=Polymorphum gilvum (strain LMG 25793 / CGMCC 1.9160 / SL003B-26A1) TaxID=991905 RepID=F2J353_POLGS|nr:SMP-30/gluconolactonase/LRE family protein [Polymorphum gilvum]ADZ69860.1 SMP-30/Gluconolaconase/LRE-like region superfamily [Polymorphum gilvum SL003B-26A1]